MAKKKAPKKTAEELRKKSEKALSDPKIIEIVRTAPENKNGQKQNNKSGKNPFGISIKWG